MRACPALRLALSALSIAACSPAIAAPLAAPPEGIQFAYLSTGGPGTGLGNGSTGMDLSGDGTDEADPARFTLTFDALAGTEIGFWLNLLTAEITGGIADFFQVRLNDAILVQGAVGVDNGGLPVIPAEDFDSVDDLFSLVGPDGSDFEDGQTGWFSYSFLTVVDGAQTLSFSIFDESDDIVDSALLVDAITFDGELIEGFEDFQVGSAPFSSPFESPVYDIEGNVTVAIAGDFVEVERLPEEPAPVPVPALGLGVLAAGLGVRLRRRAAISA